MTPVQKQIVSEARSTLGMRWSHQARGKDGKTDCAGVVLMAVQKLGLADIDVPTDYDREAPPEAMVDVCRRFLTEIPKTDLQPGDMVVLRYPNTNHIGICGDYPTAPGYVSIIHATARAPYKVVEHRFDEEWLKAAGAKLVACFRFPEVIE